MMMRIMDFLGIFAFPLHNPSNQLLADFNQGYNRPYCQQTK